MTTRIQSTDDELNALVNAARGGNQAAFGEIVSKLHLRVFRFLLRQVGSTSDAEDLTQDVFLEAYKKLDKFRGESKFSTWVIGIAFNMGRTFLRRAPERRFAMTDVEELYDLGSSDPNPEQISHSSAALRALGEAMQALPDDLREALSLVAIDGLAYEEAAELAGIPLGTMKTRVFRARKSVRQHLQDGDALALFPLQSVHET